LSFQLEIKGLKCYAFFAMSNQEIAKLLRNVAAAYTIKDERKFHFQIVAYQNAVWIV
jgi:hypothetical protein